ncbi:hypothetical protein ACFZB9_14445 [Kitasatospora sp. NPDC008050]
MTFDAVCSWIYELEVPIGSSYIADLENIRGLLDLDSGFLDFLKSQVE